MSGLRSRLSVKTKEPRLVPGLFCLCFYYSELKVINCHAYVIGLEWVRLD